MKHLSYLVLFLPIVISAQTSQLTALEAFHNTTWEWTDGANTFQVKIIDCETLRNQEVKGVCMYVKYKLIDNNGIVLYSTRQTPITNLDIPIGGILAAYNETIPSLYGQIEDRTDSNYEYGIDGMLKIVHIPCQGIGCSPQISWKITKPAEIVTFEGAPNDYNLPKDIILTKVN
jgi:hypothetical protein